MADKEFFIITIWPVALDKLDNIRKLITEHYTITKDEELKFEYS